MSTGNPMKADIAASAAFAVARAAEAALMRDFLNQLQPASGSEALRALRQAFPAAPLAARVAAMARHAGEGEA